MVTRLGACLTIFSTMHLAHNDKQAMDRAYRIVSDRSGLLSLRRHRLHDTDVMVRCVQGQTRDVLVYKFITAHTIEVSMIVAGKPAAIRRLTALLCQQEDIYRLGETKLQLDNAVGGIGGAVDADGKPDQQTANDTKKSLMKTIRQRVIAPSGPGNEKAGESVQTEDVSMTVL
jgi:hypothetical protein